VKAYAKPLRADLRGRGNRLLVAAWRKEGESGVLLVTNVGPTGGKRTFFIVSLPEERGGKGKKGHFRFYFILRKGKKVFHRSVGGKKKGVIRVAPNHQKKERRRTTLSVHPTGEEKKEEE